MSEVNVRPNPESPSAIVRLVQPVGREAQMDILQAAFTDPSDDPLVVGIIGAGGIGKTYMTDKALARARASGVRVILNLVDLYNTYTHTADGLTSAMRSELPEAATDFADYDRAHKELSRIRVSGTSTKEVEELQKKVLDLFAQGMRQYSQNGRVVLALDTAERLTYGAGRLDGQTDETEVPEGWVWLKQTLPNLGRVTIVIAGRPAAQPLLEQLEALPGIRVISVPLGSLSPEATSQYFDEAAKLCRSRGNVRWAECIEAYTDVYRQTVHECTGGNPILLALLLEYIATTEELPAVLEQTATSVGQAKEELEHNLIERLAQVVAPRHVIQYLGYLPKGADAKLLARVMDIPEETAQEWLTAITDWSVVKVRPADKRVFLHDEMYRLIPIHAPLSRTDMEDLERTIIRYYDELLIGLQSDQDDLFRQLERKESDEKTWDQLAKAISQRQNLLTEMVAYRLRQDPVKGYRRYYRYNREAILAYDVTLNAQLETELRTFLGEEDAKGLASELDPALRAQMEGTLAMQPVVRAWTAEDYTGLVTRATELRSRHHEQFASGGQNGAILDTWLAGSLAVSGSEADHVEAERLLNGVIAGLSQGEDNKAWRTSAILMTSYGFRGYLRRLQGRMPAAIQDYKESVRRARGTNVLVQLADMLNNMGFAMAVGGEFKEGRSLVEDGEAIRRRLGRPASVGLSLSTLANIHLLSGEYDEALLLSERALRLFTALNHRRGEGLARRARSEALRRQADAARGLNTPTEWIAALEEALGEAEAAYQIAVGLRERSRQAEALTEAGCCYRNMVKVARAHPDVGADMSHLIDAGARRLREAADLASAPYQKVDALVDLAWLGVYANRPDLIEEAERRIKDIVPPEYYLDQATGRPGIAKAEAEVELWPQLGKLYALHGHLAFQDFERTHDPAKLVLSGREYALALQYTGLYGDDFAGMRRAKDEVYDHLKRLRDTDLQVVARGVADIEEAYRLESSTMREFLDHRALWYGE